MIAEEQRSGILAHPEDQLGRLDAVVTGIMRTQNQLVATVRVLTTTIVDYLLDEQRERDCRSKAGYGNQRVGIAEEDGAGLVN
ncbi:MAG: hypothetical protein H7288_13120 [Kineosporiaceae bacterium]|nr:hypothetical protein [Aeromicrobium sp.]